MSNRIGRPTKYEPKMCEVVIREMSEGASKVEVCAELGICYDTFLAWQNPEHNTFKPEFLESIKKGEKLSEAWWKKVGRKNLQNKEFSYTGWYMNMKNRHGWSDKSEHKVSGDIKVNLISYGDNGDNNTV